MAHHQKTDGVHSQLAGKGNMLRRDVRFAAVGGDPHHPRSGLIRRFQIVQRADARQQQGGDFRPAHDIRCRFNPRAMSLWAPKP